MGYQKAMIVIVDSDETIVINDSDSKVKIRGNSTSYGAKKPYNLKLNKKQKLFGMNKSKKWVLLADMFDPTIMRNSIAFEIAKVLDLKCEPKYKRVEVWVDGEYKGLYLLTEKMEDVVDIDENGDEFFVELDSPGRAEEGNLYFSTNYRFYQLRSPDEEVSEDKMNFISETLNDIEEMIYSQNDYLVLSDYIDIPSFVNYYILNEYLKTIDFTWQSVYFYYKNDKLYGGPSWDHDLSCGNVNDSLYGFDAENPSGKHAINCHVYQKLMNYPEFQLEVYKKFMDVKNEIADFSSDSGWIDEQINKYADAISRNYSIWNAGAHYMSYARQPNATYDENTVFLKSWLKQRLTWMEDFLSGMINGIYTEEDGMHYYVNGARIEAGLVLWNKEYYYIGANGQVMTGTVNITNTNDLKIPVGTYIFDENGIMQNVPLKYEAEFVDEIAPSCSEPGQVAHYKVERIGKYYADGDCTTELTNLVIPATGLHTAGDIQIENKVDGTETEVGHYDEVKYCKTCGAEISRVKKYDARADIIIPVLEYNGAAQKLIKCENVSGGAIRFALGSGESVPSDEAYSENIPEKVEAGSYKVWYKLLADDSHYFDEPQCINVTISPMTVNNPVIVLSEDKYTYDGNGKNPGVKVYVNESEIDAGEYSISYQDNINAGTGYVVITNNEGGNYTVNGSCAFSISEAVPTLSNISAVDGLVYNGTTQELLIAEGSVTGGSLQYAIGSDDISAPSEYVDSIPSGTDSGNYYVWYKVVGDYNYTDIASACIIVNISPMVVTDPEIVLSDDSFTYDESEKTPSVKVYVNGKKISENEYSVSYNDNVAVGTAVVVITDKTGGNYTISGSKEFTILAPEPVEEGEGTHQVENITEGEEKPQPVTDDKESNTETSEESGYSYGGSSGYSGYSGGSYTGWSTVGGSGSTNSNSISDSDKNGTKTGSNSGEVTKPDKGKTGKDDSDKTDGKDKETGETGEDIVETSKKTYKSGKVVEKTKVTKADGTVENTKVTTSAKGTVTEDKTVTNPDGTVVKSHSVVKKNGSSTSSVVSYDKKGKATITTESISSKGKKTSLGFKNTSKKTDKKGRKTAKVTDLDTTGTKAEIPSEVTVDGVTYKITTVGKSLLSKNSNVTLLTLGDNIKTIEKNAFKNAKKLKSIYLGENITKIGKNAFSGVDNVTVYIRTDSEDKFKDIRDAVIKAGIGEHVSFVQVTK